MNNMEVVLDILKYVLPALIVFLTAYFSIRSMVRNDQKKRSQEIVMKNKEIITPIRLQAYERLTLLLERISPDALVMRFNKNNLRVKELHNLMLTTIRAEFDHNVSQQIYISPQAWEVIKNARETIVKQINIQAKGLKPDDPAPALSRNLLENMMEQERSAASIAIDFLKREVRNFY